MKPSHAAAIANKADAIARINTAEAVVCERRAELKFSATVPYYTGGLKPKAYDAKEAATFRAVAATAANVARLMRGESTGIPAPSVAIPRIGLGFGRGFGYIVRPDDALPLPSAVKTFDHLGIARAKRGARYSCGDYLIFAERNNRGGYKLSLRTVDADGEWYWPSYGKRIKDEIRARRYIYAYSAEILDGAGELAAIVRRIHADRGGFVALREAGSEQRAMLDIHSLAAGLEKAWSAWLDSKTEVIEGAEANALRGLGV